MMFTNPIAAVDTVDGEVVIEIGMIKATMSPASALDMAAALVKHASEAVEGP